MNVLLTGAFGNVGRATIDALLERKHHVRCFDVPSKANLKAAETLRGRVDVQWGDLRQLEDLRAAAQGMDGVVHLGFVIPTLSATGVRCEERPDWAKAINVGGTRNVINALQSVNPSARLVFASSLHVYGKTQHLPPPRTVLEVPQPVEHYAKHKIEAEGLVRESGLDWSILRLAAALPLRLIMDPGMFDVPLNNRIEFIHRLDAAEAFAQAIDQPATRCKTLLIGGGTACQLYYRQMMTGVLEAVGIGSLPDWVFSREPFATDWLDTRESQAILGYQHRTFDDYTKDLASLVGGLRGWIKAARPAIRWWLMQRSPYGRQVIR